MKTTKIYRHGEIAFEVIHSIPRDLVESSDNSFIVGSHGHPHSFTQGKWYPKNEGDFIIGYFVAKDTTLRHAEHGTGKGKIKKAKLPDGKYCVRRAVEIVNKELKQVID